MHGASEYDLGQQGDRMVLIVEDENVARTALKRLLDRSGFHAEACVSAEEALGKLQRQSETPQVALVDVDLPGMSGLDLVRRLAQASPDTFTILITAASGERIDSFCRAHPVGYLQKPIDFDELLAMMSNAQYRH